MLSGEFARKLRSLNRNLRVFCGNDDSRAASVYIVRNNEYEQLCGCDKNWVGERASFKETGEMVRSGWRRILRLLIQQKLVDRRRAERVFNTHLPYAAKIKVPSKDLTKMRRQYVR